MAKEIRVLIIHGWSDCSESFKGMKALLEKKGIGSTTTIYYADYESREDNITYEDVIEGLNNQLVTAGMINNTGESDYDLKIIVHSTGGLVVRHWIWRYYESLKRMSLCPVSHLVMLAPANFGSPLAQMGKSLLGGLVKGRWKVGDFLEVGKKILNGLELGSAYQWQLAHRDLLCGEKYFVPEQILTTVVVGSADYGGIRGWVNKPGTDGTVVIAGTNLNLAKLCLKFAIPDTMNDMMLAHQWETTKPVSNIAFGILPSLNHGTIVEQSAIDSDQPGAISQVLVRALQVDQLGFEAFQKELQTYTDLSYKDPNTPKYQQFLVHAVDYQQQSAMDFTLDFSVYQRNKVPGPIHNETERPEIGTLGDQNQTEYDYSRRINETINADDHTYSQDSSFRRLLVNLNELTQLIREMNSVAEFAGGYGIFMKVFVPAIDEKIIYATQNLQNILIYDSTFSDPNLPTFFYENTTTLIELQVDRINQYVSVGTVAIEH